MGRRIDPSWGGPIKQFLVPASAPQQVLSCLWDGAYKRTLAERVAYVAAAGFPSHYQNGP